MLRAAGIDELFDEVVDGRDVARLGLRGKPAPDGFLEAARRLGVPPRPRGRGGGRAGRRRGRAAPGASGSCIGVARTPRPRELRAAGADIVVADLGELAA